jgi:serine/threonine protein kinase
MTPTEAIKKINNAKSLNEIFVDLANWKTTYKQLVMLLHEDRCSEPGAKDAVFTLNQWKVDIEDGKKHEDDAGQIIYKPDTIRIKGDKNLLKISLQRFYDLTQRANSLMDNKTRDNFYKYLPESMTKISDNELELRLKHRALPISSLGTLPEHHVHWILSRMIEFAGYINKIGYVHAGINPDSIYVCPEGHGITCISFYHLTPINNKLTTASAQYIDLYPYKVLVDKRATIDIDIELAKRTAVILLGDPSGHGVRLKKTNNSEIVNFLLAKHNDPIQGFYEYRKILDKNFPKKFHELNV